MSPGPAISIHGDQGQLCLCIVDISNTSDLSIWILKDYGTSKWTLKHTVNTLQLLGPNNIGLGSEAANADYGVIAAHLEWNLIFLVGEDRTLMAYDMSRKKVHALPIQVVHYPKSTEYLFEWTSLSTLCSLVHGVISRAVKVHILYFIVRTYLCSGRELF
jgi:hypothetical protein